MDLLKILESLLYTLSNLVIYPVLVIALLFLLGKGYLRLRQFFAGNIGSAANPLR